MTPRRFWGRLLARGDILRLDERDIAALGLTTGQQTVLEVIVEKLEENSAREAAQRKRHYAKQGEVKRRQRSNTSMGDNIIFGTAMGGLFGVGALIVAPYALAAAGFTSAGIAASSFAASLMSSTAVASGGGVATGSAVAVLQSVGAAGIPTAVGTVVTTGGALVGGGASYLRYHDNDDDEED
ncbi:interferon alpha-inducible protein 6-like isoform X2 [Portunus trituberculatus]|uniref:interferon alpha-inducible protein 6-like isoform X2 n=1 Tax=Portunus trituberculatus TaxID=210409 RepID=UPI001E1D1436|nr:interferon alpha-inducible protein 6-like isoform X2 [Portunus trituberculatus]